LARIVIARELTKKFEEFLRGSVEELIAATTNRTLKGEFVVMIDPRVVSEKNTPPEQILGPIK
jgi:16S rRNA C1402 (ribose-2'-O) methylase RsmI